MKIADFFAAQLADLQQQSEISERKQRKRSPELMH
jgi:hypothetical protein